MDEIPNNVVYLLVNVELVNNITVACDQDDDIINFCAEVITVQLYLNKIVLRCC